MIFKTIEDEAKLSGLRITSSFQEAFRAIKASSSGIKIDNNFATSLNNDKIYLDNFKNAVINNTPPTEAFKNCLFNASQAAKEYAKSMDAASLDSAEFATNQTKAYVATAAQNKSLTSAKSFITEYNNGCKNVGLTQNQFIEAIGQSNSSLSKYLSGLNGGKATLGGYITSLVGAKVATTTLKAATIALNTVISMGLSFVIQGIISSFVELAQAEEKAAQRAEEKLTKLKETAQASSEVRSSLDELIQQYKALADANNGVWSIEQASELETIQSNVADLVGDQEANLDLVNGKLDQEYQKLLNIYGVISKNEYDAAESAYNVTKEKVEKGYEHTGKSFWNSYSGDGDDLAASVIVFVVLQCLLQIDREQLILIVTYKLAFVKHLFDNDEYYVHIK